MNNNLLLLVLVWKNHFLSLLSVVSSINNQTLIHNLLIKCCAFRNGKNCSIGRYSSLDAAPVFNIC